ncbi:phospholipase C/P1 nuclease [Marasmius fiardii PR-910]|nr:phospholipase C/P1 nuclease [Marasmius fiardii PR-910]
MKLLSLIALGSSVPLGVLGWGAAGHEIVATIAQMHLYPTVLPTICEILNFTSTDPNEPQCHLAPIAAWADKLKYRMRWSAAMHYVGALDDYPSQTCAFPGTRGWAGSKNINVLGAIRNTTGLLEEYMKGGRNVDTANEALKFLVHFLGDLHMPLHLTGRDRGGNSVKVLFDGRQTNLHSLWDGLLIAKNLRTIPYNYSRPLPIRQVEHNLRGAIYDPFIRRVMWEGIYGSWKEEIPDWLSCPQISSPQSLHSSSQSSLSSPWNNYFPTLWTFIHSAFSNTGLDETTDDDIICPKYWSQPIHALNCELVWPKALDEPPYGHKRFRGWRS